MPFIFTHHRNVIPIPRLVTRVIVVIDGQIESEISVPEITFQLEELQIETTIDDDRVTNDFACP